MGGLISLAICVAAAWRLYGHGALFVVASIVAVANFWSLGIVHNYKHDSIHQAPEQRPAIAVNMLTTLAGLILLVISFVVGV